MMRTQTIGMVSSIVPKKCGIATFSRDLMEGMRLANPRLSFAAIAAEVPDESYAYTENVVASLKSHRRQSYVTAARLLNNTPLDAIMLQHEYGLYGGSWATFVQDGVHHHDHTGDYILAFLQHLSAPVITTFHTVLPRPDKQRKEVIQELGALSKRLVTMTNGAKRLLCDEYGITASKIAVIPHGVPPIPAGTKSSARTQLGLDKTKTYLTVTGLIGPNKGIDLIIKALPAILKRHPEVQLLIVGQTHPSLLALEGEKYRENLIALAKRLGVCNAITFVNKYVTTDNLMRYLLASDIYLTIHGDPEQAASGTLAYAVGTGLPSISTPYRYAEELLSGNRGIIVPFNESSGIAEAVNRLIEDHTLRQTIQTKIKRYSGKMAWSAVGKEYLKLVRQVSAPKPTTTYEHAVLR